MSWSVTSIGYFTSDAKEYKGRVLTVSYYHNVTFSSILGCHSRAVHHLGFVHVVGVRWGDEIVGTMQPEAVLAESTFPPPEVAPAHTSVPLVEVQDAVYEHVIKRHASCGVLLFSDRVNRTTRHSKLPWPTGYAGLAWSCAALAKWLITRPDLGTLTASPYLNNPNYAYSGNYGICQVFMFIPARVNFFVDETSALPQPDIVRSKAAFLDKIRTDIGDPAHPIEDFGVITYDQKQ